jgi:hypothetical protein
MNDDGCPHCQIPMSQEDDLYWCLYCPFSFDKETILKKSCMIVKSVGGEVSLCTGVPNAKYMNFLITGDIHAAPEATQLNCCLVFSKPLPKSTIITVHVFSPKGGVV